MTETTPQLASDAPICSKRLMDEYTGYLSGAQTPVWPYPEESYTDWCGIRVLNFEDWKKSRYQALNAEASRRPRKLTQRNKPAPPVGSTALLCLFESPKPLTTMSTKSEKYEYIRATISDGDLSIQYQIEGNPSPGRTDHDEDVSDWTDSEVKSLIVALLDVTHDQREMIEIELA